MAKITSNEIHPSLMNIINTNTNQIGNLSGLQINFADYPRIVPEANDNGRWTRALQALANGGTFKVQAGNYSLSTLITQSFASNCDVSIVTVGRVTVTSTATDPGSEAGLLHLIGTTTTNLYLEGLNLVGNGTTLGTTDGLLIDTFQTIMMRDINCSNFSFWGARVYKVTGGSIRDCWMTQNWYGGMGIEMSSNIVVTGGNYSSNGTTDFTNGYGLSLKTTSTQGGYNSNILIQGVYAFNNKRKGIDVHNGQQVVIKGNFVVGFGDGGIYAVNQGWDGSTSKLVRDVVVSDNYVDGTGSFNTLYYGIQVGSYGTTSTDSGSFIISNNIIKNVSYSGIILQNAQSGGLSPRKVIVTGNDIENGAGSGYNILELTPSGGPNITDIVVTDNLVHASSCNMALHIEAVNNLNVANNIITVDSGTSQYGIFFPSSASVICQNNQLLGGATYSIPIPINGANWSQLVKNTRSSGYVRPYRDNMSGGVSDEMGSAPQSNIYYKQGSIVRYLLPSAGGYMGQVCVRPGTYQPSWVSASYVVGNFVTPTADNGHYYKCTTAGTSGATEPVWPTTSGATVADGTVVWTEFGASALFKQFGTINS